VKKSRTKKHRVALFIDLANVCELDMDWIVLAAQRLGQMEVARGYGNFTNWRYLAPAAERLFLKGVRLIHCPPWRIAGDAWKNCADEVMAADIYQTLQERPEIDRIIICTGDGHFVPVTICIREAGRDAIVIAPPDGASRMLQEVASRCLTAPYSQISLPLGDEVPPPDNGGKNSRGIRPVKAPAGGYSGHDGGGSRVRPNGPPPLVKPGSAAAQSQGA